MKKNYIKPTTQIFKIAVQQVIASSPTSVVVGSSYNGSGTIGASEYSGSDSEEW